MSSLSNVNLNLLEVLSKGKLKRNDELYLYNSKSVGFVSFN